MLLVDFEMNGDKVIRTSKIILILICISINIKLTMSKTKMYVIEETKSYSWNKAFEECKQMGMDLFSVKSEEEFRILKEYIKEEYGRLKPFWLGALKKNGHFKWTSTGESIKQFMWHAGEPNYKNANELCIHTWEGNFQWNDNDCRIELPFICDLEI